VSSTWGEPSARSRPSKGRIALLIFVLLGAIARLVLSLTHFGGAQSDCSPERPPAGASQAAVAYVDAVNAALPARVALNKTITSAGGVTHRDDLLAQAQADAAFLDAVRAIDFPADVAPAAATLVATVEDYDAYMLTGYNDHGYIAAHLDDDKRLNNARALAGEKLRDALALPQSRCILNRP
jgi:hypothetical protein